MESGVKACIRCAGKNLRWEPRSMPATGNSMRIMGVTEEASSIAYTCQDCGYAGNPIIFSSEEDRLKFLELKKGASADKTPEKNQTPVRACMNCASTSIHSPAALKRHSVQKHICDKCGYVGACATFENEEKRQEYMNQKKNGFR
jgi:predicted RNA-binding Zn-ribbon protein involved in translation (DUF1610 family)